MRALCGEHHRTFNLEMAATDEMVAIASRVKPQVCTLVPERREERTTEGGLDVVGGGEALAARVKALAAAGIKVSLFIAADAAQIARSHALGAAQIELHTGEYAHGRAGEIERLAAGARQAHGLGLEVAAGHGLTQDNVPAIVAIPFVEELNIGHAVVADARVPRDARGAVQPGRSGARSTGALSEVIMLPVLSRAQMRAFDAHAIGPCGVPGVVLMENAGRGATDVLVRELLDGDAAGARVVVVCGTGNNGGDGLVIARHLLVRGAEPVVLLCGDPGRVSPDAKVNLATCVARIARRPSARTWPFRSTAPSTVASAAIAAPGDDAVVDALLLGTGLRPTAPWRAGSPTWCAPSMPLPRPCLAVDLPSGLDADTGGVLGVCGRGGGHGDVRARHKLGLLTPGGALRAGRVHVVDIGVPGALAARVGDSPQRPRGLGPRLLGLAARSGRAQELGWARRRLRPARPGKIGAPQLAARGAMRAGGGLATIATWPDSAAAIEGHLLEVMTARLDREGRGGQPRRRFSQARTPSSSDPAPRTR